MNDLIFYPPAIANNKQYYQRVWQHVGNDIWRDIKQPQPDVLHHKMITAVDKATTGIEAIDKSIENLYSSGYMHNHVRMYTASLVCNMAKAHWLQPSQWMYYHLLDGDIASNNCSWQWVAAAFSSKKYYFDQDNVNKYTFSKQQHSFLDKSYEEIIAMPVPQNMMATTNLVLQSILPVTQIPLLDTSKPTLIYNSYNLDVLWRKDEDVNRVLLLEPSHFKKYPVSKKVLQFIIDLSKNIEGLILFTGEISDILSIYSAASIGKTNCIISKEHPVFNYYPGVKDSRDWMFSEVTGYYNSFFSFWKKCEKFIR
jgi:deoxyribodipyrimidine photo-lyase